jgi:hypothetical protein
MVVPRASRYGWFLIATFQIVIIFPWGRAYVELGLKYLIKKADKNL